MTSLFLSWVPLTVDDLEWGRTRVDVSANPVQALEKLEARELVPAASTLT